MKRTRLSSSLLLRLRMLLVFVLPLLTQVHAEDPKTLFRKANEYYQKEDFESAIRTYEELIKERTVSVEVYFNLGNAYFKTGNVSKSIVNYERALKLSPDDEDILFNLKIAQLKVIDKIEPVPDIFYKRWMRSVAGLLPEDKWTSIFTALFWLMIVFAGIFYLGKKSAVRKTGFVLMIIMLFLSLTSFVLTRQSIAMNRTEQKAIIMVPSVYVKSSPEDKGSDLFILHEGSKVEILDEFAEWNKVRIANGSIGWVKQTVFEII